MLNVTRPRRRSDQLGEVPGRVLVERVRSSEDAAVPGSRVLTSAVEARLSSLWNVDDYPEIVSNLVADLTHGNLSTAVEIAELPGMLLGEVPTAQDIARYRARLEELRVLFDELTASEGWI
jgi:hypothetical protein